MTLFTYITNTKQQKTITTHNYSTLQNELYNDEWQCCVIEL